MVKRDKKWWKNPKDKFFWLVYIPMLAFLSATVFSIIFYQQKQTEIEIMRKQLMPVKMDDIFTALNLEGPLELRFTLSKYPIIQRRDIFKKYYFGKEVKWKGKLLDVIKYPKLFFQVKKGDSVLLYENPSSYFTVDSVGNVVFIDYEIITKAVYQLLLRHLDGYPFSAEIEVQGNEYIDYLSDGDTVSIIGFLVDPTKLQKIHNLVGVECAY